MEPSERGRATEIHQAMQRHPAGRGLERRARDVVVCPEPDCPAPAEVIHRWTWPSTDGRVDFAKTRCFDGHVLTPTAESLEAFVVRPREGQGTAA